MKRISFKKFTQWFVELSTAHITKDDDWHLTHSPDPVLAWDLDPGWLIRVPSRHEDPDFWEQLAASAFSPAMKSLLMKIEADGCRYMRLDPDAEVHPELPTNEW